MAAQNNEKTSTIKTKLSTSSKHHDEEKETQGPRNTAFRSVRRKETSKKTSNSFCNLGEASDGGKFRDRRNEETSTRGKKSVPRVIKRTETVKPASKSIDSLAEATDDVSQDHRSSSSQNHRRNSRQNAAKINIFGASTVKKSRMLKYKNNKGKSQNVVDQTSAHKQNHRVAKNNGKNSQKLTDTRRSGTIQLEMTCNGNNGQREAQISHSHIQRWNNIKGNNDIALTVFGDETHLAGVLNDDNLDEECVVKLLEVLAKICKSSMEKTKISILAMLHDSSFLKSHIPNVLLSLQSNDDGVEVDERKKILILENLVNVAMEYMVRLPSQFKGISPIIDRLTVYINKNHLDERNKVLLDQIYELQSSRDGTVNKRIQEKKKVRNNHNEQPPDNYKDLTSYPSTQDILTNRKPFLRPAISQGSYSNREHYLDVQFRLLKEDLVAPLRDGIQAIVEGRTRRTEAKYILKQYRGVKLEKPYYDDKNGILHRISFSTEKILPQFWNNTKHLKFGSLLCFTKDHFSTFVLAIIIKNDNRHNKSDRGSLKKAQLIIMFLDIHSGEEYFKSISTEVIMVESPSFFEAYKHVLDGIKEMDQEKIPFEPYIVFGIRDGRVPDYCNSTVQEIQYDLKHIYPQQPKRRNAPENHQYVNILNQHSWPGYAQTRLNESQMKAIQYTLTSELSVIQGPPGTGKTYIGLMIAEAFLLNKNYWNENQSTPMLVVCYTNHALDQFLLGLISKGYKNVVRVGSRHSEELEQYSLRNAKRRHGRRITVETLQMRKRRFKALDELKSNVKALETIEAPNFSILIKFQDLKDVILPKHLKYFEHLHLAAKIRKCSMIEIFLEVSHISVQDLQNLPDSNGDDGNDELSEDIADLSEVYNHEADLSEVYNHEAEDNNDDGAGNVAFSPVETFSETNNQQGKDQHHEDKKQNLIKQNLKRNHVKIDVDNVRSPWSLSLQQRWSLYKHWLSLFIQRKRELLSIRKETYNHRCQVLNNLENEEIEDVLRRHDVIAMTTTAAARMRGILNNIKPKIAVIEEAAEVLEAHVLTAISKETEHLILIGDHKQLRPSVEVYELEKFYNFDVSLFERLINNGVAYNTLNIQHRMRPDVSRLVRHIYPALIDHESVLEHPHIKGISKDVYFITHTRPERENSGLQSKENDYEARYLAGLCRYLLQQGYDPKHITVLTGYTAQLLKLKSRMPLPEFKDVRITVVDNFQGEENDIILLSLVRSNMSGAIGFLEIENRICVALSRARHGLYVIGNFDLLKSRSKLWGKIIDEAKAMDCFQTKLELRCQNHPQASTSINTPEDFSRETPNGGCLLPCELRLECGHSCPEKCHVADAKHEKKFGCKKICGQRLLCGHQCQQRCHFGNDCYCKVMVQKQIPLCGHEKQMECLKDPSNVTCNQYCLTELECGHPCRMRCHAGICGPCHKPVSKTIPACDHIVRMECGLDEAKQKCMKTCDKELACYHRCMKKCHVGSDCDDEKCMVNIRKTLVCNHTQDVKCFMDPKDVECASQCSIDRLCGHTCNSKCHFPQPCYQCKAQVRKKVPICGHTEIVECYERAEDIECRQKCHSIMLCGHKCQATCHKGNDQCGPCTAIVEKEIPACGHKQKMDCSKDPATMVCQKACPRTKECGHRCMGECGQLCINVKCKVRVKVMLPCDHEMYSLCFTEIDDIFCNEKCRAILKCSHVCTGTCGSCKRGRLHVNCLEACDRKLSCLHTCPDPCTLICSPCKQKCENRCPHMECKEECGKPCAVCTRPCTWNCQHQNCSSLCSQLCDRQPCNEPCQNTLECGHLCIGLCGENCPQLCRICDQVELENIFGCADVVVNERFLELIDCNHIFEVKELDRIMMMSGDADSDGDDKDDDDDKDDKSRLKSCPRCGMAIRRSWRYGNMVKSALRSIENQKKRISETPDVGAALEDQLKKIILDLASAHFGDNAIFPTIQQMVAENGKVPRKSEMVGIVNRFNKYVFVLTSDVLRAKSTGRKRHLLLLVELYERFMEVYRYFYDKKSPKTLHKDIRKLQSSVESLHLSSQQIDQCHVELQRLWLHKRLYQFPHLQERMILKNEATQIQKTNGALAALEQGHLIPEEQLLAWIHAARAMTRSRLIKQHERQAERAIADYKSNS